MSGRNQELSERLRELDANIYRTEEDERIVRTWLSFLWVSQLRYVCRPKLCLRQQIAVL